MRKSVLALALEGVSSQPAVELSKWWAEVHARSKAVITSKMKTVSHPGAAIRIAMALCGSRRALTCMRPELQAVLDYHGVASEDIQQMLTKAGQPPAASGETVQLGAWYASLPPACVTVLRAALLNDGDASNELDECVQRLEKQSSRSSKLFDSPGLTLG